MLLAASTRLGPYEVLAPLGAGGMGEVYRAHDTRLDREVAVKVLPASLSNNAETLRRFKREARAAAVSHPNLLAIFDFGTEQGLPYIVTELLQGETLRERLRRGPLSQRKSIEIALQVAQGLGTAHEKGIVHRDLKPENVFVTTDGRIKILDFGLATLTRAATSSDSTLSLATSPGQVVGTPGYMSPEQVRGLSADARSDIFALGALLYEMLSAQRAFSGHTAIETLSAILHEDPPDLATTGVQVSPALERIVRHCIEKNPPERFQSVRDVAFALEEFVQHHSETAAASVPSRGPRRYVVMATGALLLTIAFFAGLYAVRHSAPPEEAVFHRITYRRGTIRDARFTPDGMNVVYGAAFEGHGWELFTTRSDSNDSRELGLEDAQLLAVSARGELALLMRPRMHRIWNEQGTLATVAGAGGAPRELLDNITFADWSPDGSDLAVIRVGTPQRTQWLEYPRGKPIYRAARAHLYNVRVSPRGEFVAFFESPDLDSDYGRVVVVDRSGNKRVESRSFSNSTGLAWSADAREVWFSAMGSGGSRALHALDLKGRQRTVLRVPAWLTLKDISRDGRVLLCKETESWGILASAPGKAEERDLSWYSWSLLDDVSLDGRRIVFSEGGEAGEDRWGIYIRDTSGGPAARLGDGVFGRLSPDGKWVVASSQYRPNAPLYLVLLPTGAGEARTLAHAGSNIFPHLYGWLPDSSGIVYAAETENGERRMYAVSLGGGQARPIAAEGTMGTLVSPDGQHVVARRSQDWVVCPLTGGAEKLVPGMDQRLAVVGWDPDGRRLRVAETGSDPLNLLLVNAATGARQPWRKLMRSASLDRAGLVSMSLPRFSRDGYSYAYTYHRQLSDLYVVHGVR